MFISEDLIRKIDNPNFKGLNKLTEELDKVLTPEIPSIANDAVKQQKINDLYKNLSYKGMARLDKIIDNYNKAHPDMTPLKKCGHELEMYQDEISQISLLMMKYGKTYGQDSKADKLLYTKVENVLKNVAPEHIQDVIDEVSKDISQSKSSYEYKDFTDNENTAFSNIVDKFSSKHLVRAYVANFDEINYNIECLYHIPDYNNEKYKNMSQDDFKKLKFNELDEFKQSLYDSYKLSDPKDFQAAINQMDKMLDYDGRKALDEAVKQINKMGNLKFETRRIHVSEWAKDNSWQKFQYDSYFVNKLKDFHEKVRGVEREGPVDKYDRGLINGTLRTLIYAQKILGEVFDFVGDILKDGIDKLNEDRSSRNQTYDYNNYENNQENQTLSPDDFDFKSANSFGAFDNISKNIYKHKGEDIMKGLSNGDLSLNDARRMFVMDIAYTRTLDEKNQEMLINEYAKSFENAVDKSNTYAKNCIQTIIAEYQQGKYETQIKEAIENGLDWSEFNKNTKETKESTKTSDNIKTESKTSESKNKPTLSKRQSEIVNSGNSLKSLHDSAFKFAHDLNNGKYKNNEEAVQDFTKTLGMYHHEFENSNYKNEFKKDNLEKLAVSVMIAYADDKHSDMAMAIAKVICPEDKNFQVSKAASRLDMMLKAADTISLAEAIEKSHGMESNNKNLYSINVTFEKEFKKSFTTNNEKENQKMVQTLSNRSIQYSTRAKSLLAAEAKVHGMRTESNKEFKSLKDVEKKSIAVAESYKVVTADSGKNFDTKQKLSTLCDRIPASLNPNKAIEYIKISLKDDEKAMKLFESDLEDYNKNNKSLGFDELGKEAENEVIKNNEEKVEEKIEEELVNNSTGKDVTQEIKNEESKKTLQKSEEIEESVEDIDIMALKESLQNGLSEIDPDLEDVEADLDDSDFDFSDDIETDLQKEEITIDDLVEAFDNNKDCDDKFAFWISDKTDDEVAKGIKEIDFKLSSRDAGYRLIEALDMNNLSHISNSAPQSLKDYQILTNDFER